MNGIHRRIIIACIFLRGEENELLRLDDVLKRFDRFLAADKERHNHMRENDNVAQRQNGVSRSASGFNTRALF